MDYLNDEITEQINGSYTFKFAVYMDDEKSQYIDTANLVEVEGQYFNIVKHRRTRSSNGDVQIVVECEQVSYDLLFHVFEDSFIHSGSPVQLMSMALEGTAFTIGTVEISNVVSVELKENATARSILFEIAAAAGGELRFDQFTVSLLGRRGRDRGVQFRLGKNVQGIVKDVNGQSGEVLTSYEIDVVELNTLPEFEGLEYFELGDTVDIIDEELQIDEQQRIIEYAYSPRQRINSKVVIANYIEGIQDTIYRIQTTTVGKDKWMYGVKIGPDEGIVIERYDKLAKSKWNADEFRMQKGDGNGGYTDSLYFDAINQEYTFTGIVRAGQFIGGSIKIGNEGSTFFEVGEDGKMKAIDAEFTGKITGSEIVGGTITGSLIRTSAAGPRIEQSSVLGFRTYDGNSVNRIRITTSSNNDVAAIVYYTSSGGYAGEINSYSNSGLSIFSENLFLGSNNSASPIRFQGAANFAGVINTRKYNDLDAVLDDIYRKIP
ncbi:prophage endopeptidase tail family protein [Paenibacillus sp. 7516]|uniref:prophage endopeptidase tail family protein n=1 Tax=Paenibacillus sp. 7516 TaxID=2022549 RepID=UPI0020162918|nr:prophage endopeptidase tail family protein [Paenibacillus sp. 7516]